jgi:chromatin remodeling complex protein RSC6
MSAISSSDASSKMSASAAKTSKAAAKTAAAVTAPAPAVAAPAPVAETTTKAKGGKKAAAAAATTAPVAAAAPAPAVVETPAVEAPAAEEDITVKLTKAIARQAEIAHQQKALAVEAASTAKEIEKLAARLAKRAGGKRKRASGGGGGDAFVKPVPVTNELAAFLGLEKGASISRAEVTKRVYAYLKSHGLQKGKLIHTDASLRKLLGVKETDQLTILNLQTFLNHHYIKPAAPAAN